MRHLFFIAFIVLTFNSAFAQESDSTQLSPKLSYKGFIDTYYAYDFNEPTTNYRQPFLYNHNRHNEFNLNLGLVQVSINDERYRASLGLQVGNYAEDVYALESDVFKHVHEAYVGVALDKKSNIWVDAGIFISHLGFESPISSENLTLTRSLLPESSPYYLSGAKITWTPNSNWLFSAVVTNGWQRIQRVQGNSLLSFGTQVAYDNGKGFLLNWSTFIGTDDPDSTRRMRYFNDFYTIIELSKKINLIAGIDIGFQQKEKGSSSYQSWVLPVIIGQYVFNEKWAMALRAEYVNDENNIVTPEVNGQGFITQSYSINFDYKPVNPISLRIEGRWLNSENKIYPRENSYVNDNFFLVGSLSILLSGEKTINAF